MSGLTKIFIVLSLVFSLTLSVLIVLMVSRQQPYKAEAENIRTATIGQAAMIAHDQVVIDSLNAAVAAKDNQLATALSGNQKAIADATAKIADLERQRVAAESQRATAETSVSKLTNTVETLKSLLAENTKTLDTVRPENTRLITQIAELTRTNNELQNTVRASEQAIRRLQEQIVANDAGTSRPGASAPAESADRVASLSATGNAAATPVNSTVTDIAPSAGGTLIETKLGSRDGIKVNSKLAIYRNGSYVGDAVVQRVTADASVAQVTTTKQGETVQKGDIVQTNN